MMTLKLNIEATQSEKYIVKSSTQGPAASENNGGREETTRSCEKLFKIKIISFPI
jgi:hypothetical protein